MNFGDIKSIHFVGIGGIGMSGIAEILTNYRLTITGCDAKASPTTDRLSRLGVGVAIGHEPRHIEGVDLVVISSAIRPTNPEVVHARERNVPVIRRAEMLGRIMHEKKSIGIAGTHGKTTTTAMTAIVLAEAGFDPTVIVGGVLRSFESNAKLGQSDYFVVEADEYDRSFLALDPTWAVITNIEADHLDCYRDLDDIREAFAQYAAKVPPHGVVIGCVDDVNVAALLGRLGTRSIGYGLGEGAALRATNIRYQERATTFELVRDGRLLGEIVLRVPGDHNVRNALAATAVALELGAPFAAIARALGSYSGVERRFQFLGESRGAIVIDDYAHHPTEIRATLTAARKSYPRRRIVALFQPHLYSRTRDFSGDFADALAVADEALVTPIYPAREEPIEGVSSGLITGAAARAGNAHVKPVELSGEQLVERLRRELGSNDLLVTMGAGDIHRVAEQLVEEVR